MGLDGEWAIGFYFRLEPPTCDIMACESEQPVQTYRYDCHRLACCRRTLHGTETDRDSGSRLGKCLMLVWIEVAESQTYWRRCLGIWKGSDEIRSIVGTKYLGLVISNPTICKDCVLE